MQTSSQNYLDTTQPSQSTTFSYKPKPLYEVVKRITETTIALVLLIGLSPLWLAVAVAIKLTSPGPIFFRGRVVGRNGREFTYYKFRSMRHNNDNSQHQKFIRDYVQRDLGATGTNTSPTATTATKAAESGSAEASKVAAPAETETKSEAPKFKLTGDKRVTSIGKIIRKLSVDEVPQLFNVVRGDMAIVGPRPPVPYEYSLYDDWCKQRLTVLPGITGLAQVRMRGTASFRQMVETDLEYIENRSFWLDWQILLKTPLAMLKGA